jgi:putative oxidoreductase
MKNKILFVLCLLFGLLFAFSGANKLFQFVPIPENMPTETAKDFAAMIEISWLMPLLGIMEIIGGILFVIPKTRALAAIMLFPIMVGIVLMHVLVDTQTLPMAIVLSAILGWVIYENREKYLPMIK